MEFPAPYSGWEAAAERAWKPAFDPRVVNPVSDYSGVAAAYNAAAAAAGGGVLTPEPYTLPYYAPGTATVRGGPSAPGCLAGLTHGPSGWDQAEAEADVAARPPPPLYAPEGQLLVEPVTWGLDLAQPCACLTSEQVTPYSVTQALLTAANVVQVRAMLVQAGLVEVDPALAGAGGGLCPCRVMGGREGYLPWAVWALQYNSTSFRKLPDPGQTLRFLNTTYTGRVLSAARAALTDAVRANYARVMGGLAYAQQPLPTFEERGGGEGGGCGALPAVLPGTGCKVLEPADSRFATLALTAPVGSARHQAEYAAVTGVPVGRPNLRVGGNNRGWS